MNWADDILYNENVRTNRANNQTNTQNQQNTNYNYDRNLQKRRYKCISMKPIFTRHP